MFKLIGTTLKITRGDTGTLTVNVTGATFGSDDRVQLTVADKDENVLLQKVAEFDGNEAEFEFENADTADIEKGVYLWELRFVKDATVTGDVITGGSDIETPYESMTLQIIDALADIGATGGN
ncbi:MAG: hypothetical protein IKE08_01785 [Clostridia bacterium]|nr:hypothetical protein [Clostridia bacterium]